VSSVLEVVQAAFDELGLYPRPFNAVGAGDQLTQQITALYTAVGQMLVRQRVWRGLLRVQTYTVSAPNTTTLALPADYDRPVNQTEWDQTNHWPLMGPMTPQQMQTLKSGIISEGPRIKFRLIGKNMELFPPAQTGQNFVLNYISKGWLIGDPNSVTPQPYKLKPTADTDEAIFDDRLMIAGVKLRFFQAKGFDTTAYADDFQVLLDQALAQDSGAQKLTMAADPATYLVNVTNIPDGNVYGMP
jgi:hypothetical protein